MNTNDTIILARKHLGTNAMRSSAAVCLADAVALQDDGGLFNARLRALRSLAYSVGRFHPDYKRVNSAILREDMR